MTKAKNVGAVRERERELHSKEQGSGFVQHSDTHRGIKEKN